MSPAVARATIIPMAVRDQWFTKGPIMCSWLVKWMRGTMAKVSTRERMTCGGQLGAGKCLD